jgi:hypothetical protein
MQPIKINNSAAQLVALPQRPHDTDDLVVALLLVTSVRSLWSVLLPYRINSTPATTTAENRLSTKACSYVCRFARSQRFGD